jgi:hypothetical protein
VVVEVQQHYQEQRPVLAVLAVVVQALLPIQEPELLVLQIVVGVVEVVTQAAQAAPVSSS